MKPSQCLRNCVVGRIRLRFDVRFDSRLSTLGEIIATRLFNASSPTCTVGNAVHQLSKQLDYRPKYRIATNIADSRCAETRNLGPSANFAWKQSRNDLLTATNHSTESCVLKAALIVCPQLSTSPHSSIRFTAEARFRFKINSANSLCRESWTIC
jgi:hypothetical protein